MARDQVQATARSPMRPHRVIPTIISAPAQVAVIMPPRTAAHLAPRIEAGGATSITPYFLLVRSGVGRLAPVADEDLAASGAFERTTGFGKGPVMFVGGRYEFRPANLAEEGLLAVGAGNHGDRLRRPAQEETAPAGRRLRPI